MPLGISRWHKDHAPNATRDVMLARSLGAHLDRHYRGHYFRVEVNSEQGIARVTLPELLPETFGYVIRLADLFSDPAWRVVTRAGGDLLEAFDIRRGARDSDVMRMVKEERGHVRHARTGKLAQVNVETGELRYAVPQELTR
jgi:hypothetical protein